MNTNNTIKLATIALTAAIGLAVADRAAGAPTLPPASTKQGVTYAADIKAILDASCVKCHSGNRPKGGLKLDTLADTLKGGKDGKILKSGDSVNSYVVKAVGHVTSDPRSWMPPMNNREGIKPLTPEQIGLIRAWIDQGAK
jgi:mono/diheme cytochrome c family protein